MNYKPGDKVKVTVNGATWEDEIRYKGNTTHEYFLQSGITVPENALTILARKPKQWDEMTRDEKLMLYKLSDTLWCNDDNEGQKEYENLVSFILGGVPYARVDE